MSAEIFTIPAEMIKAETKRNNSVKLIFESQENISAEALKRAFEWRNQVGHLVFAVRQLEPSDLLSLPEIKTVEKGEKSPGQKLRAALYVMWQHFPEDFKTDEEHYKYYMEKFRQHILDKLPKE